MEKYFVDNKILTHKEYITKKSYPGYYELFVGTSFNLIKLMIQESSEIFLNCNNVNLGYYDKSDYISYLHNNWFLSLRLFFHYIENTKITQT